MTDEDRAKSLKVRLSKKETAILEEQAKQAVFKREIAQTNKPGVEDMILGFITGQYSLDDIGKKKINQAQTAQTTLSNHGGGTHENISDNEIRNFLGTLPKQFLSRSKNMSDDQLKRIIKSNVNLSDENTERAIKQIRSVDL